MKSIPYYLALVALPAFGGIFGDLPDDRHAWSVHDANRPVPPVVNAEPGKAPSDAVVLFDGTNLDAWQKDNDRGETAHWRIRDGILISSRGGGIRTRQNFGDCQFHIEWRAPENLPKHVTGQARYNSGVFFGGVGGYEIQILDSYNSPTYADGQAASVYGQNPPLVNAMRPPKEWQTYDIIWHQPRRGADGKMLTRGSVTVLHNGVLVQDHWEYEGGHTWCRRLDYPKLPAKGPIFLQDHGNDVEFRNIWIREIPAREENTTHGTPWVNKDDVLKLRAQTAARLLAERKDKLTLEDILEIRSYFTTPENKALTKKLADDYIAEVKTYTPENIDDAKMGRMRYLNTCCRRLVQAKVFPPTCTVLAATDEAIKRLEPALKAKKAK